MAPVVAQAPDDALGLIDNGDTGHGGLVEVDLGYVPGLRKKL